MDAFEQLAIWGADPESDLFVSASVGEGPAVTYRATGDDATHLSTRMQQLSGGGTGEAPLQSQRYGPPRIWDRQPLPNEPVSVNLKTRDGITFVTIAGTVPVSQVAYRFVITPAAPFL